MTCPINELANTHGNVTLQCWDSQVKAKEGTCSYNCEAGEMVLKYGDTMGMISYGELNHSETNETDCEPDTNFTGKLTLGCDRGVVSIFSGSCYRHCLPATIGPGVKAVPFPRFDHKSEMTLQCLPGFLGQLDVQCVDGNATILE